MLYNKPRSFSWRVRPVFSSSPKATKEKKRSSVKQHNDNLTDEAKLIQKTPSTPNPKSEDVDIILKGKPTPQLTEQDSSIIDVTRMPVIEGIPMLILPEEKPTNTLKEAEKPITENITATVKSYEKLSVAETSGKKEEEAEDNNKIYDLSQESDEDFGIPILKLKELPVEDIKSEEKQLANPHTKAKSEKKKERSRKSNTKVKQNRAPGKRTQLTKIAAFFVLLYAGAVLSFIIPLRPVYSESEKRNLTKFPKFTVQALSSGSYFAEISTWFSDTFPFREQLLKLNGKFKGFYGFENIAIHGDIDQSDDIPDIPNLSEQETEEKPPVEESTRPHMPTDDELKENGNPNAEKPDFKAQKLGAIIVAGDSAYEYYGFSQKLAPRFISAVDKIEGKTKPTGKVYALINPTSIDIKLNDALRSEVNSANQEKALQYFNASLKNTVAVDTIYSAQRQHRDEYTYFRTDHHWTALGAYYSYREFCLSKGITPTPLSKYETKTYDNFTGTFYASAKQNAALGENPDSITTYIPFNNAEMTVYRDDGRSFKWKIINDVTDYNSASKYSTFIAGDNALSVIKNNDNPDGEVCLVVKDSYANALVPFLIPHYSTIYVIDPRHYEKPLSEFCEEKKIDDVLFICNISVTRNDIYISALENLLR